MQGVEHSDLIERCINKDRAAWDEFVERYCRLVFWAIGEKLKRLCGQCAETDAEDIFQEIFVSLWSKDKLKTVRNRKNIKPWLVMVAGNATLDYLRRKKPAVPVQQNIPSRVTTNPRYLAQQKELRLLIERVLDALPARETLLFKLSYLQGMTHREISEMLNIPLNTVSTVIKRARDKIASKIRGNNLEKF